MPQMGRRDQPSTTTQVFTWQEMQVHCHGEGEAHSMAKDIIAYFLSHSSPSLHPFPTVLGVIFAIILMQSHTIYC